MPRSTNKRELILQTALDNFAHHGYAGTSIDMIATDAKISKSLMYNYFRSKQDLLMEIMDLAFADIHQSMTTYQSETDPKKAITDHVRSTCKIIKKKSHFWRLVHGVRLQEGLPGILVESYLKIMGQVSVTFREIFKKLGYENPELEALLFLSQIDGMVVLYLHDDRIPIDKLGEQLIKRYTK